MREVHGALYIKVDFEVARYEEYPEDKFISVWGWVGDYQVRISLPYGDKQAKKVREFNRRE